MKSWWAILIIPGLAFTQEKTTTPHPEPATRHEKYEKPSEFEAEFAASDIFRSGSYLQPLWKGLGFEGHYFGGLNTQVGLTGVSWAFRLKEFRLSPGVAAMFGSNQFVASPALTIRWDYEHRWLVTQGLTIQGFRKTPVFEEEEHSAEHRSETAVPKSWVRPTIADGSHVSLRWRRITAGGTWEHIHFREGSEWKGGGRLAIRLLPRVSGLLYVLGPGRAEWRGGILLHPTRQE